MLRSIWEMARIRTIALPLACMLVLAAAPLGGVVHGLPRARQGPPWPVVVPTEKERFVILPSGKVLVVPAVHPHAPPAIPPDAYFLDRGSGRWVDLRHHHVVVHRDRRVIWRSRSTFDLASANGLSGIVVGARGVAFQVRRTRDLFVAAGRGPERRVATNEWPELWSASGNLITVRLLEHRRFAYLVRSPHGERLTTSPPTSRSRQPTRGQRTITAPSCIGTRTGSSNVPTDPRPFGSRAPTRSACGGTRGSTRSTAD